MYNYINEKSIYQYFGDDDLDMVKSMITIILETNIHDLKELGIFYKQSDFETIKKRCHKAKPSMSYIGALESKKLLEAIESNLENSTELNTKLQANLVAIEQELLEFMKKL